MNEFQSTQSSGLLKNYYDSAEKKDSFDEALKNKRKSLMLTKLGVIETPNGGVEHVGSD